MAVGEEVFGVAPGCFGPSVVVPEQLVVAKPPSISFEEAATTPTVYVTVFAAFGDLDTFNPNTKVCMLPFFSLLLHLWHRICFSCSQYLPQASGNTPWGMLPHVNGRV